MDNSSFICTLAYKMWMSGSNPDKMEQKLTKFGQNSKWTKIGQNSKLVKTQYGPNDVIDRNYTETQP